MKRAWVCAKSAPKSTLCLALLAVAGCTSPEPIAKVVSEPAIVLDEPVVELSPLDCSDPSIAGDDGIGGTGCPVVD